MRALKLFLQNRPLKSATSIALLIMAVGGLVVVASMQSWPRQIFSFQEPAQETLPEQVDIAGWTTLSRNSINIGGTVGYQIRILYRPGVVIPDLDVFEKSVDVLPFTKREIRETERTVADGIKEYMLEYVLQGVEVQPHTRYQLDPAVLYYKIEGQSILQSLQIQSPEVHVVGYYPQAITGIALQDLKEEIRDPSTLRQLFMGTGGIALLILCVYLLWHSGRRRRAEEYQEAENLWREFNGLDYGSFGNREYILYCETVFTRLLQLRTGLSPKEFWSGKNPKDGFWKDASIEARKVFQENYRPEATSSLSVSQVNSLLKEAFSLVVEEERLQREQEPSYVKRLSQQPRIIVAGGIMGIAGVVMFILAALPVLWLSPDILQYNKIVSIAKNAQSERSSQQLQKAAAAFVELAENIDEGSLVKAAALYNSGTILASSFSGMNEELLARLTALFSEMPLSEVLDHDPERSLATLTHIQASLQQGERNLRDAVRVDYRDENISRNLEIVIKRRQEVLTVMSELLKQGHVEPLDHEELLDLINSEMALEFELKEGQEAPGYYIGEHF